MHKIVVIGRLGQDPEMRFMPNGNAVTSFSVASDNPRNGEKHTEWIKCSTFGKLAATADQYLRKGLRVYLEGPFHTNEYTRQDGVTAFSIEMVVNNMEFLGGGAAQNSGNYEPEEEEIVSDIREIQEDDVDDLPF